MHCLKVIMIFVNAICHGYTVNSMYCTLCLTGMYWIIWIFSVTKIRLTVCGFLHLFYTMRKPIQLIKQIQKYPTMVTVLIHTHFCTEYNLDLISSIYEVEVTSQSFNNTLCYTSLVIGISRSDFFATDLFLWNARLFEIWNRFIYKNVSIILSI